MSSADATAVITLTIHDNFNATGGQTVADPSSSKSGSDQAVSTSRSLRILSRISCTLIIVGIILLLLGALGVFPDSVDSQRLSGTYTISNVKYGLYIIAGLLGWLGCHMSNKVLDTENQHKQAKEVQLPASALPSSHRSIAYLTYSVLILSAVSALVSIALTCWEIWLTKSTSQKVYSWIIVALTILQRLFYIWACLATCKFLHSVCLVISRDGSSLTVAKGAGLHIPFPAEIMSNKGTGLHIPFPAEITNGGPVASTATASTPVVANAV